MKTVRFAESSEALPLLTKKAEDLDLSYTQFLFSVMSYEEQRRGEKLIKKRLKWASFPVYRSFEEFSFLEQLSLKKQQFNQLIDLSRLDQLYNLIF